MNEPNEATFSKKKSTKFADFLNFRATEGRPIKRYLSKNKMMPRFFRIRSRNNSLQFYQTVNKHEVIYNPKGYWYIIYDDRKFKIPSLKEHGHYYDISYLERKEVISLWNRLPLSSFATVMNYMKMFGMKPRKASFFRIEN